MSAPKNTAEHMRQGRVDLHPEISSHVVPFEWIKARKEAEILAVSRKETSALIGEGAMSGLVSPDLGYDKSDLSRKDLAISKAQVIGESLVSLREYASAQDANANLPPVA